MTTDVHGIVAKRLVQLGNAQTFTEYNTFTKGLKLGTRPATLDAQFEPTLKYLALDTGMKFEYTSNVNQILYGALATVYRSGGTGLIVGGQFSALNSPTTSQGCYALVSQAWNQPNSAGDLIGCESAIIQETSTASNAKVGLDVVFKDRADGAGSVTNGLGTDLYNAGAKAIMISSQARSSSGERCGWNTGIHFYPNSLDESSVRKAIGIDFASVPYLGTTQPTTAYYMTAAIRMRDYQSILWNGDPSLATVDPANPIRTFFHPGDGRFKIINGVTDVFGVDVTSGHLNMKALAKICFQTDPGNSNMYYDTVTSTLLIGNGSTVMFGVNMVNGALTLGPAAAVQLTVGAAGAAAAIPATASKYLKVSHGGTNYVIPMFLAA